MTFQRACLGALIGSLSLTACKTTSSPDVSSTQTLTESELSDCQFKGKRYLLVIAPEPDFQQDLDLIQTTFGKHTPQAIIDESYVEQIVKGDASKKEACLRYFYEQESKYEVFSVLGGSSA